VAFFDVTLLLHPDSQRLVHAPLNGDLTCNRLSRRRYAGFVYVVYVLRLLNMSALQGTIRDEGYRVPPSLSKFCPTCKIKNVYKTNLDVFFNGSVCKNTIAPPQKKAGCALRALLECY
jgi:hypothetical protein